MQMMAYSADMGSTEVGLVLGSNNNRIPLEIMMNRIREKANEIQLGGYSWPTGKEAAAAATNHSRLDESLSTGVYVDGE